MDHTGPKHMAILFDCVVRLWFGTLSAATERIKASKRLFWPKYAKIISLLRPFTQLSIPQSVRFRLKTGVSSRGGSLQAHGAASTRSPWVIWVGQKFHGLPWVSMGFLQEKLPPGCQLPGLEFRQHTAEATSNSGMERSSPIHPWVYIFYMMLLQFEVRA